MTQLDSNKTYGFKDMPQIRPVEIKTYHSETYDRISPSNSKFDAKGKTLLITAGATGIGYSISESFAKAGIARIIIIQRRESVLAAAKASLEKEYPNTKVETYAASQSDFPRMTEIIQEVGEIDVLIPCATNTSSFEDHTIVHATRTIKTENIAADYTVNVIGLFHMVKEFLALPSTASGGPKSVIHVSSAAAQLYIPGMSSYCSTKSAANQVITHFGYDEPEGNVKFYSFHPGTIASPLATEYVPIDSVTFEDEKLPGDFSVWLASPEAEFLNGRYVWAAWDVDEMVAMKEKVASNPFLLTMGLVK